MEGKCAAVGCAYQMKRFIVNVVLRSRARERPVLALAQDLSPSVLGVTRGNLRKLEMFYQI